MHFMKFETSRIQDTVDFIKAKGLHRKRPMQHIASPIKLMATGGGAYKFAGSTAMLPA